MTSTNGAEEVLKQDARGRVRVSPERRGALLDEFDRSGMSGAQFARVAGINYQTFAGWVCRRKRSGGEGGGEARRPIVAGGGTVRLFEAVLGEGGCGVGSGVLRVELPGGSRVLIDSPGQLPLVAELVRLVAQSGRARC